MDIQEAINRGNNLLMSGSLAVLELGLIPEILRETEWIDRGDDIILALLAITVSGWYLSGKNRFQRSFVPFGCLLWLSSPGLPVFPWKQATRMQQEMNSV